MLTRAFELFSEHLTNWGLVWFGVIFWGSILNAAQIYFFGEANNLVLKVLPYLLGLLLGLMGKYKGWFWIN